MNYTNLIKHLEDRHSVLVMQLCKERKRIDMYRESESMLKVRGEMLKEPNQGSFYEEHIKHAQHSASSLGGALAELKTVLELLEYEEMKKDE